MKENLAYMPTKAEEKLIEVLVNPEHKQKNVIEVCEIAGISQRHYYDIFKKAEFVTHYKQISFDLVRQSIMPVLSSVIKEAKAGSFQHSKMILEMADMYTEKRKHEHSGETGVKIINDIPRNRS